jgi:hypothetical protein
MIAVLLSFSRSMRTLAYARRSALPASAAGCAVAGWVAPKLRSHAGAGGLTVWGLIAGRVGTGFGR